MRSGLGFKDPSEARESREGGDVGAALQARTVRGLCKGADPAWAGRSENKGGRMWGRTDSGWIDG